MSLICEMIKTYKGNKLSQDEIKKVQDKKLKKIVKYARNNSPYYKELYSNIPNNFKLEELPTTNKIEMMKHFDNFITDSSINMKRIEEFTSNIDNVGRMIDNKYLIFKTSGSTGNPALVLYDKKSIDVSSSVATFRTFARSDFFKKFIKNGKRTAGVFANYGFYLACGMSRYLELKMGEKKTKITIDVNLPEEEIINRLNEFNPSMLSGYPSNLSVLANYRNLTIKPDIVITGGELLTDNIRNKLEDKFNCYVQTHYSCTEAGEIACECSEKNLHINEDYVIVEPVDKNNNPVGYGVLSDKVLITNLANYIQPFIRYELNDRVIVHDEKCKCGKHTKWIEIEGRTDDILEFHDNILIAPMSFYKILEEIKEITRFQLVQKSSKLLELRIISDNKELSFKKAREEIEKFLNSKNIFDVEIYLSNLNPKVNRSGKYNHVYKDF